MQKINIILFEEKVPHIIKNDEILYSMEGILKYFSYKNVHIDSLIQNIQNTYPCFKTQKISNSSSKYYLNTINALRLALCINTKETTLYKDWMIKCTIERMNETICPMILYDRLKTILYKKGIRKNYSFIKSDINLLNKRVNYIEVDQRIIDEDIKDNNMNLKLINEPKIVSIKIPRNKENTSTNIL